MESRLSGFESGFAVNWHYDLKTSWFKSLNPIFFICVIGLMRYLSQSVVVRIKCDKACKVFFTVESAAWQCLTVCWALSKYTNIVVAAVVTPLNFSLMSLAQFSSGMLAFCFLIRHAIYTVCHWSSVFIHGTWDM